MRIKIWLLAVSLFMFSCGATKHVVNKANTRIDLETTEVVESLTEVKTTTAIKTNLVQEDGVITEIIEFDTTLPVDKETGTPPIKKKTLQSKHAIIKKHQTINSDSNTSAAKLEWMESSKKDNTTIITEEKTKRGLNWIESFLCVAGIIAILIFFIRIFLKHFLF